MDSERYACTCQADVIVCQNQSSSYMFWLVPRYLLVYSEILRQDIPTTDVTLPWNEYLKYSGAWKSWNVDITRYKYSQQPL